MTDPNVASDAATEINAPVLAETPEVATPEADVDNDTQEHADATPEDRERKLQARFERRISRTTAARYQAEARATQAAQDAEQLRQRLAQYEQPQQPTLTPDRVLPIAQQLAHQMREQEKTRERVDSVLVKGKALDGFTDACNAVNAELPFYAQDGKPSEFLRVVLECDSPEKVLHYLGTNPEFASDLADLSPTQVARRLDRLERDLSKPVEPKQSTAPKQFAPVKPATKDDGALSDGLSIDEWASRFNKQRKHRG